MLAVTRAPRARVTFVGQQVADVAMWQVQQQQLLPSPRQARVVWYSRMRHIRRKT